MKRFMVFGLFALFCVQFPTAGYLAQTLNLVGPNPLQGKLQDERILVNPNGCYTLFFRNATLTESGLTNFLTSRAPAAESCPVN